MFEDANERNAWNVWLMRHAAEKPDRPIRVRLSPQMAYAITHRAELSDCIREVAEAGELPADLCDRIEAAAERIDKDTWTMWHERRYGTLLLHDAVDAWVAAECLEGSTLAGSYFDDDPDRHNVIRTVTAAARRLEEAVRRASPDAPPVKPMTA